MSVAQRGQRTAEPVPPPLEPPPADVATHPEAERVWAELVRRIAALGVGEAAIDVWIRPIAPIGAHQDALCVEAPRHVGRWFRRRYAPLAGHLVRDEGTFTGLLVYDRPEVHS